MYCVLKRFVLFLQQGVFGHEGLNSSYQVRLFLFRRESPSGSRLESVDLLWSGDLLNNRHLRNFHH